MTKKIEDDESKPGIDVENDASSGVGEDASAADLDDWGQGLSSKDEKAEEVDDWGEKTIPPEAEVQAEAEAETEAEAEAEPRLGQWSEDPIASSVLTTAKPGGSNRFGWIAILVALLIVVGGAFAGLSYLNSKKFVLLCDGSILKPMKGRYLPSGFSALEDAKWKQVSLPAELPCIGQRFVSQQGMEQVFAKNVLDAISTQLAVEKPLDLAAVETELVQAKALAESTQNSEFIEKTAHLSGDLDYFRAKEQLAAAKANLLTAEEYFDAASAKQPLHQKDVSSWQAHLDELLKRFDSTDTTESDREPEAVEAADDNRVMPSDDSEDPTVDGAAKAGAEVQAEAVPEEKLDAKAETGAEAVPEAEVEAKAEVAVEVEVEPVLQEAPPAKASPDTEAPPADLLEIINKKANQGVLL